MKIDLFINKNWIKLWNRPNSLQQAQHYSLSATDNLKRILGAEIRNQLYFIKRNNADIYFIKEEYDKFKKHIRNICLNNSIFLKESNRYCLKKMKKVEKYFDSLNKLNFKKLRLDKSLNDNNEELVYKYEKLLNEF